MEDSTMVEARKSKKRRKIFLLLFIIAMTLTVLIVSTYAWFIGVGSVKTSTFMIEIDTARSLELSLDGENWFASGDNFVVTREGVMGESTTPSGYPKAYSTHTNNWLNPIGADANKGLSPVSTSGVVDSSVGRLVFYGKSSLTATKGGYRLISSRIDNYSSVSGGGIKPEDDMYITFDLFIRNGLDSIYNPTYDALDDEAVYLTTKSKVVAEPSGAETEDYGLANSVRIAFVQIGRVMSVGSNPSDIIGINCTPETIPSGTTNYAGYHTGLCNVPVTIWEPNDTFHNSNLISYFNNVCKTKSIVDSTITYSNNACPALVNGTATNTYVIKQDIVNEDNVDIYDGLNGFTVSNSYKLNVIDTFTDTEKAITGHDRPPFFLLAANSVTKLRVYIYLEGQDVDNYDLVSRGEYIKVNFGFTKDIFDILEEEDNGNESE